MARASIEGSGRVREAMNQSATVIREMGKRSSEIGGICQHNQCYRRANEHAFVECVD
jgi:hypothetical protein